MSTGNFIYCDYASDRIYFLVGFTSAGWTSIATPSTWCRGLTHDATDLYSCDYDQKKLYKHVGKTTTITSTLDTGNIRTGSVPYGMTCDGTDWMYSDSGSDRIIKTDGWTESEKDGFIVSWSPSANPAGLTWDGTDLYIGDNYSWNSYRMVGFSGTIDSQIVIGNAEGCTWDGTDFYVAQSIYNTVRRYRNFTTTIEVTIDTDADIESASTNPIGCTWDDAFERAGIEAGSVEVAYGYIL